MIPFTTIVAAIGLSLSLFLVTTFKGFDNYHQVQQVTHSYDTSSLAAASRVARSASNLLAGLSSSLATSNATSASEINNRYQLLQNYLSEIDTMASANPSVLMDTIAKGLNYGSTKVLHKSYTVDLIQSNYIPAQETKSQARYSQVLVSDANVAKIISPLQLRSDLDAGSSKLRISTTMLSKLVSDTTVIAANPSAYGLEIDNRGIDLSNLPNGTRVDLQVPLANLAINPSNDKNTTVKLVRKQAVAQIRFNSTVVAAQPLVVTPAAPAPVVLPAPGFSTSCNAGWQWSLTTMQCVKSIPSIDLILQAIPNDQVGIIFNPNKAVSITNPVEIVNKKTGGMNSIYTQADGNLHVTIGMIPTKANGISNNVADAPKILNGDFEVSATLYGINAADELGPNLVLGGTAAGATVTLDTLPRMRTRYATVSSNIRFNGRAVPAGSVVVAVRKAGLSMGRPDAADAEFESYRVYSREGIFLGQFGAQFGVDNASKLRFNYTAQGTIYNDANFGQIPIYQEFSTNTLFNVSSPFQAVAAWLRMQSDLAANMQVDILNRKSSWQTRIFNQIYTTGTVDFGITDPNELVYIAEVFSQEGNIAAFKEVYPDPVAQPNSTATTLFASRFDAAVAYAKAAVTKKLIEDGLLEANKTTLDDATNASSDLATAKAELSAAKTGLDAANKAYDDYIKSLAAKTVVPSSGASTAVKITTPTVGPSTISGNVAPVPISTSKKNSNKKK